jgi:orotate phosphoribosyltransferase
VTLASTPGPCLKTNVSDYKRTFFDLALRKGNLRFGEFTLKSGRLSPYFFNAGGFDDGASLATLADCFSDALMDSGVKFDMLFGPAYKGIPLAAAVAISLARRHDRNVPFCYNRKEAKDHGEGGTLVGAALKGRVLIVDDVISAGTSVRESMKWITDSGATPAGVAIALDRQERGQGALSAAREVEEEFGVPVVSIAGLDDLIVHVEAHQNDKTDLPALRAYRARYGTPPMQSTA